MEAIMKKTILIVDDMELNRGVLALSLNEKYNTLEAENGLVAMNLLLKRADEISLILLDILMPVMDGFEFMKQVQDDDRFKKIPVILVTSETYEDNVLRGIKEGVRDVIAKPFDPYLLCKRVDNLIQLTESRVAAETAPKGEPKHRVTALVVDDKSLNRMIIRAALDETYDVLEAPHGRDAIFLLENHREEIGVILLDIIMPIMDGIETMKEMKKRNLLGSMPVLAITAEESSEKIEQIKELGISEVIHKPFNPVIVKNRVDYLVELSDRKQRQKVR